LRVEPVSRTLPLKIVEQCAIAGAFNPDVLLNDQLATQAAGYVAKRLDHLETEYEKGWTGTAAAGGGIIFAHVRIPLFLFLKEFFPSLRIEFLMVHERNQMGFLESRN
jgi:hypothetical protein